MATSNWATKLMGFRTFIAGLLGIGALTFGMWMVDVGNRSDAFFAFAGGIVGILTTLAGKAAVDSLSNGTGFRGAVSALMTDAKPGTPAPKKTPDKKEECSPEHNG
jgi:hypothetical protein